MFTVQVSHNQKKHGNIFSLLFTHLIYPILCNFIHFLFISSEKRRLCNAVSVFTQWSSYIQFLQCIQHFSLESIFVSTFHSLFRQQGDYFFSVFKVVGKAGKENVTRFPPHQPFYTFLFPLLLLSSEYFFPHNLFALHTALHQFFCMDSTHYSTKIIYSSCREKKRKGKERKNGYRNFSFLHHSQYTWLQTLSTNTYTFLR